MPSHPLHQIHTRAHVQTHIPPHSLPPSLPHTHRHGLKDQSSPQSASVGRRVWSWGSVGLVIQLFNVYLSTAYLKLYNKEWKAGTAVPL